MNTASENRLKKVHPELARRVTLLIEALANKGHTVEVGISHRRKDIFKRAGPSRRGRKARGDSQIITVWQSICAV